MKNSSFPEGSILSRRVAFCETDAMGVVHHSNYIRFFEESRVAWMRERGLMALHVPEGQLTFAVLGVDCQYRKPLRFDEPFSVWVEGRLEGIRIVFRYAIWNDRCGEWCATGRTELVALS